ncbi:two-component system sensor histidine kinase NtrB [Paenibacillus flagellatus]|nr:PAS domain-containing sensor histidine kinase [Paenibacillus flagellatus]
MAEIKDSLLQLLLVLLPIVTVHIYLSLHRPSKHVEATLGLVCFGTMLLCMIFAFPVFDFYYADLRLVPFIVGILYGGRRFGVVMSVLYFGFRYALWGGGPPFVAFAALHVPLIVIALLCVPLFARSGSDRRAAIGLALVGLASVLSFAAIEFRIVLSPTDIPSSFYVFIAVYYAIHMVSLWVSIMLIQSGLENRALHRELKASAARTRNEALKLKQLLDASPYAVLMVDRNGVITEANETFFVYNPNYSRESLIGCPYRQFVDMYGFDYETTILAAALRGEETRLKAIDVKGKMMLSSAVPILDREGAIIGAVGLGLDVSEVYQLRQQVSQMERLSLVGRMAASITHEIRNPMAVVRGFVQLMQERTTLEHQKPFFELIVAELDRTNEIINDFLSLAQNRITPKQMLELNDLIRAMHPLIAAEANMRRIGIRLLLDSDVPPLLLNDKEIKQLILNLTRNAVEAMDDGGVLTVETRFDGEAGEARMIVSDTGPGIPPQTLERLFEPFFTTKERGTGLGLTVCLSIVDNHGGRIDIRSEEGKGTDFIVTLKAEAADSDG